jgi:hypothetical protein
MKMFGVANPVGGATHLGDKSQHHPAKRQGEEDDRKVEDASHDQALLDANGRFSPPHPANRAVLAT